MRAGLILAGGRSSRFGSEKAVARLGGQSLLWRIHHQLSRACEVIAVSAPPASGAATEAKALAATVLSDPPGAALGPLTGVLAGLDWAAAQGADVLFTLPCDTPLTPPDLLDRLAAGLGAAPAAVARAPGGVQPLCAAWSTTLTEPLRRAMADGHHPSVRRFLEAAGGVAVDFDDDGAFFNLNTLQDLAEAERRLAGA